MFELDLETDYKKVYWRKFGLWRLCEILDELDFKIEQKYLFFPSEFEFFSTRSLFSASVSWFLDQSGDGV